MGKRVRKISVVVFIVIVFLLIFTGCANKNGLDKKNPVMISVWHYYNGANKASFDQLVNEFNETVGAEKGIIVDAYSPGSITDLTNALEEAAEGKVGAMDMPDIFATYVDTAKHLDELGVLAELDQYFTKEELAEYVPSYITEGRFDAEGHLKVFPIAKSTEVLCVNKTDWDKFAAATGAKAENLATWEGLTEIAGAYYDWSGGSAFFGRDAFANYMLIGSRQLGKEIFRVEGEKVILQFEEEIIRKLWENYYIPYVKGYFLKEGRYASDDAKTGKIIAYIGSSSGASFFPLEVYREEEGYPIEHLILPVPNFEGTEPCIVQQGAGMAVTKSNQTKEYASSIFLKWFTDGERNVRFALESAYMPVKIKENNMDVLNQRMEEQNLEISPILKDVLKVSIQETNEYTLFTSKAFDKGYDARSILEEGMQDTAKEDRAWLLKQENQEEAIKKLLSEEYFQTWYRTAKAKLDEVIHEE